MSSDMIDEVAAADHRFPGAHHRYRIVDRF